MTLKDLFNRLSEVMGIVSLDVENSNILTITYYPITASYDLVGHKTRQVEVDLHNGNMKSLDGNPKCFFPLDADKIIQQYVDSNICSKDDNNMIFGELVNQLDSIDGVGASLRYNSGSMADVTYHNPVDHYAITLDSTGHIDWCGADKSMLPDKAWDLIDRYRTQVRYRNACDDYQAKRVGERMTFHELANQLDDLGLTAFTHQDGMGNKYLEIPNFADSVHIYANHTIKYMGSKHKFWATITNSRKVHKVVNKFVKGDNHMTKKEINEQISEDIQQLARDLTKKKEIEHSTKMSKKIADDLGVKLPKKHLL